MSAPKLSPEAAFTVAMAHRLGQMSVIAAKAIMACPDVRLAIALTQEMEDVRVGASADLAVLEADGAVKQ